MISSTLRLALLFSLGFAATLPAQETDRAARRARAAAAAAPAPATPAQATAPGAPPPPYVLKKKSVFTATAETQRVPFWPIGWVKRRVGLIADAPVQQAPKVELNDKSFRVTSILVGNPSLAIINGRTYMEGEFIRTPRAPTPPGQPVVATPTAARVRVYRINDGAVILQYQAQFITITLQRPEIAQKTGRDELLQEDRP